MAAVRVPEESVSKEGESRRAASRVGAIVPEYLSEGIMAIAAAKGVTVPRLAEHALPSYYALKASGKRAALPIG